MKRCFCLGFLNFQFQDFSIFSFGFLHSPVHAAAEKESKRRKRGELNDPSSESICRDANCHGTVFKPLRNDRDRVGQQADRCKCIIVTICNLCDNNFKSENGLKNHIGSKFLSLIERSATATNEPSSLFFFFYQISLYSLMQSAPVIMKTDRHNNYSQVTRVCDLEIGQNQIEIVLGMTWQDHTKCQSFGKLSSVTLDFFQLSQVSHDCPL